MSSLRTLLAARTAALLAGSSSLAVAIVLLLASCTDPGLCYEENHPHTSAGIYINYDWQQAERPASVDSMRVIAVRTINHRKYGMIVSVDSLRGHYFYNAPSKIEPWIDPSIVPEPEPEPRTELDMDLDEEKNGGINEDDPYERQSKPEVPEPPLDPYETVVDHFPLAEGDYRFFTMNADTTELRYTNVSEYLDAPGDGMTVNEIQVIYRSYEPGDSALKHHDPDFLDRNPAFDYIQSDFPPIYVDSLQMTTLSKDVMKTITFHPYKLTQDIDLYFTIVKDESEVPFVIDSVRCELSGIPYRAGLFSGHLYLAKTRKMQFAAQLIDNAGNEKRDTTRTDSVRVHAGISVLTLVNNKGLDYQTGPGFLQVMVYAHAQEPVNGEMVTRRNMLDGIFNLHEEIAAADLIEYDRFGQWARKRGDHHDIRMVKRLKVGGRSIVSGNDGSKGNGGIDVWKESDDGQNVEL